MILLAKQKLDDDDLTIGFRRDVKSRFNDRVKIS